MNSQEPKPHELSAALKKRISIRYLSALFLIGALAFTTHVMLGSLIQTQESASSIVNAAGRRRFTSQSVVFYSALLVHSREVGERARAKAGILAAAENLEKNHEALMKGNSSLNIPFRASAEARARHENPPVHLDARVRDFLREARALVAAPPDTWTSSNTHYAHIIKHGPTDLLEDLDGMVTLYQKESESDVAKLRQLETVVFALTLLLLTLEALFIFRPMVNRIVRQMDDLRATLLKVAERTQTLETIYENVKSGFLLVDASCVVQPGMTNSCHTLLGQPVQPGASLPTLLGLSQGEHARFGLMVRQVFDDVLPEALSCEQIPGRVVIGERVVKLEGSVIRLESGAVSHVMFTLSDITAQWTAEEKNRHYASIIGILRQKDAFLTFLADARRCLAECEGLVRSGNATGVRFLLHTLKGNAGVFQLDGLIEMINATEERATITEHDIALVAGMLKDFLADNVELLDIDFQEEAQRKLLVDIVELTDLCGRLLSLEEISALKQELVAWIDGVKLQACGKALEASIQAASRLASRLGKDVRIVLETPEERVDLELLEPLLSNFGHLLRNSLVHGIERPEERFEKAPQATIGIAVRQDERNWIVSVADDGRGIDIEKVLAKALSKGFLSLESAALLSEEELLGLVFLPDLSTADAVTLVSGRGFGMSSVKEAITSLGGTIEISSVRRRGCRFTITVPKRAGTHGAISKRAA